MTCACYNTIKKRCIGLHHSGREKEGIIAEYHVITKLSIKLGIVGFILVSALKKSVFFKYVV